MKNPVILIADDDSALLTAMSLRLQSEGYRVFTTQDGYQALAIARREQPDLLILDINMPAGSGISVQQRIQAIGEIITPPVIFITGNEITEPIAEEINHRNARILQKPFDTCALLATVRECLLEYAK